MVFGVEEEGSASEEGGDGDEVEGVFGDDDRGEEADFLVCVRELEDGASAVPDLEGGAHAIDVGVDEGTGGAHLHPVKVASAIENVVVAFGVAKGFDDGEAHFKALWINAACATSPSRLVFRILPAFFQKTKKRRPEGACASVIFYS